MLRERDAAFLIGDAALTADTTGLLVLDLAAEWFALTGLPFVFAMWAVRAGVAVPDGVRPFLESRRIGMANVPSIAAQAGAGVKLPPQTPEAYPKTNIHYYPGSEERRGVGPFFPQGRQLGPGSARRPH